LRLPPRTITPDDYYTPPEIIEAARRALGKIDIDPASHAYANMVVKALTYFTESDNGLTKKWSGKVWVNPPFSDWQAWVPKIIEEWSSGRVEAMCALCGTPTLTSQYFAPIHDNAAGIAIMKRRINFWGGLATSAPSGHAIFYFGSDFAAFAREFSSIGHVYRSQDPAK
jgi:hypothetical protein